MLLFFIRQISDTCINSDLWLLNIEIIADWRILNIPQPTDWQKGADSCVLPSYKRSKVKEHRSMMVFWEKSSKGSSHNDNLDLVSGSVPLLSVSGVNPSALYFVLLYFLSPSISVLLVILSVALSRRNQHDHGYDCDEVFSVISSLHISSRNILRTPNRKLFLTIWPCYAHQEIQGHDGAAESKMIIEPNITPNSMISTFLHGLILSHSYSFKTFEHLKKKKKTQSVRKGHPRVHCRSTQPSKSKGSWEAAALGWRG